MIEGPSSNTKRTKYSFPVSRELTRNSQNLLFFAPDHSLWLRSISLFVNSCRLFIHEAFSARNLAFEGRKYNHFRPESFEWKLSDQSWSEAIRKKGFGVRMFFSDLKGCTTRSLGSDYLQAKMHEVTLTLLQSLIRYTFVPLPATVDCLGWNSNLCSLY